MRRTRSAASSGCPTAAGAASALSPTVVWSSLPSTRHSTRPLGSMSGAHLSAGLLREVMVPARGSAAAAGAMEDGALVHVDGPDLVMSTDSFVVSPLFFPGGDIGCLAVHGTVNDLAMMGALPVALSL